MATWKRITAAVTLLVVLLLPACDSRAASTTGSPTVSPTTGSPVARLVFAQPDFMTHTIYATGQNTFKNPGYIGADNHGGFYVVDYDNSRVLHFPSTTGVGVGPQADQVYGQPDYTSNTARKGAAGLNHPHGVAIDPNGGLYISDMLNNRVLHYPGGSTIADRVYGQLDFTTNNSNPEGASANSLYHPQGIAVDSSGFYVADSSNNRVLHYPVGSTIADFVYGQGTPGNSQANFTSDASGNGATGLNNPRDVAVDSTGLYVADSGNHRVVHYAPGNPTADRVYGQPDFTSTSVQANQGLLNPTAGTLDNPTMVVVDHIGGLYIADRNNNRILYYPPSAQTGENDPPALRVYGQRGFTTRRSSTTASTFNGPGAVAVDNTGNLFVLDIFNQRVLKFVTGLHVTGQPPAHTAEGASFRMSVTLQDVGSGIVFTDYTGPVTVQIKSDTGTAGATLRGMTTVNAISGAATFSGLSINRPGSGFVLSSRSPGYAPADTASFSISSSTGTEPPPVIQGYWLCCRKPAAI
jgi:sugar lactone lactonase YvrE